MWGLYLLGSWSVSRSLGTALAAGLVWGFLPTVRYPAVLYGLVPLLFLLFDIFSRSQERRAAVFQPPDERPIDDEERSLLSEGRSAGLHDWPERRIRWGYLAMAVGVLIPIGALFWHNQVGFGAFWKTGYSLTNEQTAFSPGYFIQHSVAYIRGLHGEGAGLFFFLGIAGVAALWTRGETRRLGLLLTAALMPITALYMAYYWSGGGPQQAGASMRFLIPTFFLYTLVGVFLLKCCVDQWPTHARIAVPTLLLLHAVWGIPTTVQTLRRAEQNGARQVAISRWIGEKVEPGSLVIAQMKIQEQLSVVGDWRLVDEALIGGGPARLPFPRPQDERRSAPQLGPRAAHQERAQRYRELTPDERRQQLTADLSAWAGDEHRIYWIVPEEGFQSRRRELEPTATFSVVDSLELSEGQIGESFGPGGFPGPPRGVGRMRDKSTTGGKGRMRRIGMPGGMGGMGGQGMRFGSRSGKLLLVEWMVR